MNLSLQALSLYFLPTLWTIIALTGLKGIDYVFNRRLRPMVSNISTIAGEYLQTLWSSILPIGYVAIVYVFLGPHLPAYAQERIWGVGEIIVAVQAARLAIAFTIYLFELTWKYRHATENTLILKALSKLLRYCAWLTVTLLSAQYLGYDISKALTGLGIAGVVASLAGQTILSDIFNYLVIYFDRPFEVGDYITTPQDVAGTVEYIGIKSTRLRAAEGQLVVLSNSQLMASNIQNFKNMEMRRVVFHLYLDFHTPSFVLGQLPGWIREIIQSAEDTEFERAHFVHFAYASPVIEVSYVVMNNDYVKFLNVNQFINLHIKQLCEKRNIQFVSALDAKGYG